MKRKCEICRGKGGYVPSGRKVIMGMFVSCTQCNGKGSWWTNRRPKQKADRKA